MPRNFRQTRLLAEQLEQRLAPAGITTIITRAEPTLPSATPGNGDSLGGPNIPNSLFSPARTISADGRFVAHVNRSANLGVNVSDTNLGDDIFLYDGVNNTNTLVSRSATSPNVTANSYSGNPVITGDGRYVLFESVASDLVPNFIDANGPSNTDLYLFDRTSGTVTLVSHDAGVLNKGADAKITNSLISRNGERVAFTSGAKNLYAGLDTSGLVYANAYAYDVSSGANALLSHQFNSLDVGASADCVVATVADDGSKVTFHSIADNLLGPPGGPLLFPGSYIADVATRQLTAGAYSSDGPTFPVSGSGLMSGDGNIVVFASSATNIVPGYTATASGKVNEVYLADLTQGTVELVSGAYGSLSTGGNGTCTVRAISQNGRFIVYFSKATNLISGVQDQNGASEDIFIYDRLSRETVLVSHAPESAALTSVAGAADVRGISDDGRYVTYRVKGVDLAAGYTDANGTNYFDAFLYDRLANSNTLLTASVWRAGYSGNARTDSVTVSADGSTVAIVSWASDLVSGLYDANQAGDLFTVTLATGAIQLSSTRGGLPSTSGGGSNENLPGFESTPDGRWVVYSNFARNVVAGQADYNNDGDVFLMDRMSGTRHLVSHSTVGLTTAGNGRSLLPHISADGRYVVFRSYATDLVPNFIDGNGPTKGDSFLFDRITGQVTLITHALGMPNQSANAAGGDDHYTDSPNGLTIGGDGRYIGYMSKATDILPGGNPTGTEQVYLFDRFTGTTRLVSRDRNNSTIGGDLAIYSMWMAPDGLSLAFRTGSTNLISGQTNVWGINLYRYDITSDQLSVVNHVYGDPVNGSGRAGDPSFSGDGRFITYTTLSDNLTAYPDTNESADIFVYDSLTSVNTLVSHVPGQPTIPGDDINDRPRISADGRYIIYLTEANNLVSGYVDNNGEDSLYATNADLILFDRLTGENTLLSHAWSNAVWGSTESVSEYAIAGDGKTVIFTSRAADLLQGYIYTRQEYNVYAFEISTGITTLVSHHPGSPFASGSRSSGYILLSMDGRTAFYWSAAEDFVSGDYNGLQDAFAVALAPPRVFDVKIADGSGQRSVVKSLTVTFDQPVTFTGDPAAAFKLVRNDLPGTPLTLTAAVSTTTTTIVTLTFAGPLTQSDSLSDGDYTLSIIANQIVGFSSLDGNGDGVAGDDYASAPGQIFRLHGDSNGDRRVDLVDFVAFRSAMFTGINAAWFDNDGDGVDLVDFIAFRQRLGMVL